jgi:hypothetical protein
MESPRTRSGLCYPTLVLLASCLSSSRVESIISRDNVSPDIARANSMPQATRSHRHSDLPFADFRSSGVFSSPQSDRNCKSFFTLWTQRLKADFALRLPCRADCMSITCTWSKRPLASAFSQASSTLRKVSIKACISTSSIGGAVSGSIEDRSCFPWRYFTYQGDAVQQRSKSGIDNRLE